MKNSASKITQLFYPSVQAALIVGCHPSALRLSRTTGYLWGQPTPPYSRVGKRVCMYALKDLEDFIARFPKYSDNADEPVKPTSGQNKKSAHK